jgi:hypothetical protein
LSTDTASRTRPAAGTTLTALFVHHLINPYRNSFPIPDH